MTTNTARQPKGVPVGGQFAATAHNESDLTLAAPAPALPELEPYGEIPAPLDGQTLETGEPAAATFEDSYRAYFRPLDEHEAVHGPYTTQPSMSEGEILDLAGIRNENLGRHRGTYLERDEGTGEPVIVVHTRNGGGNRECWQDDCDGQCTGCIQTDAIPRSGGDLSRRDRWPRTGRRPRFPWAGVPRPSGALLGGAPSCPAGCVRVFGGFCEQGAEDVLGVVVEVAVGGFAVQSLEHGSHLPESRTRVAERGRRW